MTTETLAPSTCIVRDTAARKGRTLAVAPGRTAARYLHYGRIILDARTTRFGFDTGERETGLVCLRRERRRSRLTATSLSRSARYDALYAGRDERHHR